jgi:hypothetical protein
MDPITIAILSAIGSLAYLTHRVIFLALLTLASIKKLFLKMFKNTRLTKNDTLFVMKNVKSQECSHVYGIFDKSNEVVREKGFINARQTEQKLVDLFGESDVIQIT